MTARVTTTDPVVGGSSGTWGTLLNANVDALTTAVNALGTAADHPTTDFVSAASPTFTGTPTAPTAAGGTNTTQLATTAFVTTAASSLAPLASPTFTGTPAAPTAGGGTNTTQLATTAFVTAAASTLAPLASPTFTGTPAAPTAGGGTNTTQVATTAFVATATSTLAPLASPTLTGTPAAPTATPGTNTTQLATTAFVAAATPVLTVASGSLSGDVAVSATTLTTVLTTSSLAVGTWLLTAVGTFLFAGTGGNLDMTCAVGGATATFTGAQSVSQRGVSSTPIAVPLSTVVVVTVAGTILVRAYCSVAVTAKQLGVTNSYANATGYTAIRIA